MSEGFSFRSALVWVPDSHCTTNAATLGCLSGLASSESSVCAPGTLNQSMGYEQEIHFKSAHLTQTKTLMQVHLLGPNCRGYVLDWGCKKSSLCVLESCSGHCCVSKRLHWTRACAICSTSLLSHSLENVCFSLFPHLSNYWYLKCIQLLPLSNMCLTLLITREVGGDHVQTTPIKNSAPWFTPFTFFCKSH